MAIQGPYPDGGYELWCDGCGCKITCFSIVEIFGNKETFNLEEVEKKFKEYDTFYCSDCLPILGNKVAPEFDKEHFYERMKEWLQCIGNNTKD